MMAIAEKVQWELIWKERVSPCGAGIFVVYQLGGWLDDEDETGKSDRKSE